VHQRLAHARAGPPATTTEEHSMKILLILATLGLATFVVLRRRNPDFAERVQSAVTDAAKEYDGVICYGAIGVGGTKMKLHRAAVAKLFESNDQVMDAEQVYALGEGL